MHTLLKIVSANLSETVYSQNIKDYVETFYLLNLRKTGGTFSSQQAAMPHRWSLYPSNENDMQNVIIDPANQEFRKKELENFNEYFTLDIGFHCRFLIVLWNLIRNQSE